MTFIMLGTIGAFVAGFFGAAGWWSFNTLINQYKNRQPSTKVRRVA